MQQEWLVVVQVERHFGADRFTGLYLLSGIAGSLVSHSWLGSHIGLGASGAICGLYGAFFVFQFLNHQVNSG